VSYCELSFDRTRPVQLVLPKGKMKRERIIGAVFKNTVLLISLLK